ncbi:MAG: SemiSWEET family transporter [Methanobacterium sp.]|nr:SemiSWEET family transporter [Methanobacterium sp.]
MEILEYIGLIACFFSLALYTSTVDQIKNILKTKTSSNVSFIVYLMMFLNCFFWTVYGSLKSDYFILTPNGIGIVLAALTLVVIHKYRTQ